MCQENKETIYKHFLKRYQFNYKDPSNFIYVENKKNIDEYQKGESWNYYGLFKLYMKLFNKTEIYINKYITSFPIYPNMTKFYCRMNRLTSFPTQPNMVEFYGSYNKLVSFATQPNMVYFQGDNNKLTSFPNST